MSGKREVKVQGEGLHGGGMSSKREMNGKRSGTRQGRDK